VSAPENLGLLQALLQRIPVDASCVLELGARQGLLGQAYLRRNPAATYIGVEPDPALAQQARGRLSGVIEAPLGSSESWTVFQGEVQGALQGRLPQALVLPGTLHQSQDPVHALSHLRGLCAAGAVCVAGVANLSHWGVMEQLLAGRWGLDAAQGADRPGAVPLSNLHSFTLDSAVAAFQRAGWSVLDAVPLTVAPPEKTAQALKRWEPLARELGLDVQKVQRDLSAQQWVIRAVNGPAPKPLNLAALGIRKRAGVTEARVDFPMSALASLPGVQAVWSSQNLSIPSGWAPGVLTLQRQFMNMPEFNAGIERLIQKEWVVVSDIDDDPHHWPEYVQSNFRAFRGVHAVTVSTEPLAQMVRQWNPHVQIFANAIAELPDVAPGTPKNGVIRICFGALNRGEDWAPVMPHLARAARELGPAAQWVVVHDRAFFDALPADCGKTFHPTLPPQHYLAALAQCDVALLPLADTPFNRLKSDLKFIECCAAGAVPICSPVVYAERPGHLDIGVFAQTPQAWHDELVALVRDPASLQARRSAGHRYVLQQRLHAHQAPLRRAWYQSLAAQRGALELERQARLAGLDPVMPP
jgi:hypothetical protein